MWLHWDRSWITCLTKATGKGQTQTKEGWRNHLSFATLLTAHSYFLHRRPFSLPNNQHWFGIAEAETLCLRLKARSKHTGACMSLRAERGKSKMMSVSTYKRPSGWKLSSVYLLLLFPTTCIGSSTNNLEEQQHPVRSCGVHQNCPKWRQQHWNLAKMSIFQKPPPSSMAIIFMQRSYIHKTWFAPSLLLLQTSNV